MRPAGLWRAAGAPSARKAGNFANGAAVLELESEEFRNLDPALSCPKYFIFQIIKREFDGLSD